MSDSYLCLAYNGHGRMSHHSPLCQIATCVWRMSHHALSSVSDSYLCLAYSGRGRMSHHSPPVSDSYLCQAYSGRGRMSHHSPPCQMVTCVGHTAGVGVCLITLLRVR